MINKSEELKEAKKEIMKKLKYGENRKTDITNS